MREGLQERTLGSSPVGAPVCMILRVQMTVMTECRSHPLTCEDPPVLTLSLFFIMSRDVCNVFI